MPSRAAERVAGPRTQDGGDKRARQRATRGPADEHEQAVWKPPTSTARMGAGPITPSLESLVGGSSGRAIRPPPTTTSPR